MDDAAALDAVTTIPPARAAQISLAVTFVTLALAYGVWYAYTVFLVALLREFGWSRAVLGGAFSLFTLVQGAWNPVVGWLTDRVGPRRVVTVGGAVLFVGLTADGFIEAPWQLYALFGVLTAIGVSSAGWTPAVTMVQRHFRARLGLALGIAGSGIGVGIFLVVPLCQVLIDAFGWRSAFRILGVLCAVWIVPATWFGVRESAGETPEGDGGGAPAIPERPTRGLGWSGARAMTLGAAALTLPFWCIASAHFLGNLCSQMLLVHQAAYLVDHGITPLVAASVISIVGAASIVGKTGGGWLSDSIEREVVYAAGMASMILGIAVLGLVAVAPSPWSAYGYAVLLGLGYSVTASLIPAMVRDRFSGPHFGAIFGAGQTGSAIGSALGAWLGGRVFDVTGSYAIAFGFAVAVAVAAAGSVWTARWLRRRAEPG